MKYRNIFTVGSLGAAPLASARAVARGPRGFDRRSDPKALGNIGWGRDPDFARSVPRPSVPLCFCLMHDFAGSEPLQHRRVPMKPRVRNSSATKSNLSKGIFPHAAVMAPCRCGLEDWRMPTSPRRTRWRRRRVHGTRASWTPALPSLRGRRSASGCALRRLHCGWRLREPVRGQPRSNCRGPRNAPRSPCRRPAACAPGR